MKCIICGKYVESHKLEKHLFDKHRKYYKSPIDYVWLQHNRHYGKERSKFIINTLFGGRKK